MSTVVPLFHRTASTDLLALLNRIQSLAVTISCQGQFTVSAEYVGHVHWFEVTALRISDTKSNRWIPILSNRADLKLDNALETLRGVAVCLESLLNPTPGDAA